MNITISKQLIVICLVSLFFACESTPNVASSKNSGARTEHVKLYEFVAAGLIKHKKQILKDTGAMDPIMNDYISMDYYSFKEKYKFSDIEMDNLSNSFKFTFKLKK